MTRYLNGQHALEKIPIKEGISRKDCKRVLDAMEKYICIVSSIHFLIYLSTRIYSSVPCIRVLYLLFVTTRITVWWIDKPLAIL